VQKNKLLMTPGPTNVPFDVLQATAKPMIHHRTDEFSSQFKELNENLKLIFGTNEPVLTFPSSGSGMMEAAIVNLFSQGDTVISVSIGVFGDRFGEIAEIFGLEVKKLVFEWGEAVNIDTLKEFMEKYPEAKAVIVTYNETSTGISNDVEAVASLTKDTDKLCIVDAVSALGGLPLYMDKWGIDVVISASQKALMLPPGLGFAALSKKAWGFVETSTLPKFYWNFKAVRKGVEKEKPDNLYTPAISLIIGAKTAVDMILKDGLENVYKRHSDLARAVREGFKALKIPLLALKEEYSSDVITAAKSPEGFDIDFDKVREIMNSKYNIMVAGGQKKLSGKIIRIGHMGYFDIMDIISTFTAFEMSLYEYGYKNFEIGVSIKAIMQEYL
jgi:aspartate aminotransferase-like enzyme